MRLLPARSGSSTSKRRRTNMLSLAPAAWPLTSTSATVSMLSKCIPRPAPPASRLAPRCRATGPSPRRAAPAGRARSCPSADRVSHRRRAAHCARRRGWSSVLCPAPSTVHVPLEQIGVIRVGSVSAVIAVGDQGVEPVCAPLYAGRFAGSSITDNASSATTRTGTPPSAGESPVLQRRSASVRSRPPTGSWGCR